MERINVASMVMTSREFLQELLISPELVNMTLGKMLKKIAIQLGNLDRAFVKMPRGC